MGFHKSYIFLTYNSTENDHHELDLHAFFLIFFLVARDIISQSRLEQLVHRVKRQVENMITTQGLPSLKWEHKCLQKHELIFVSVESRRWHLKLCSCVWWFAEIGMLNFSLWIGWSEFCPVSIAKKETEKQKQNPNRFNQVVSVCCHCR